MSRKKERKDNEDQETLNHIYNRAGKVCANKGQRHLRQYESGTNDNE